MIQDLLREIQVKLKDCEARFGANRVTPHREVFVDSPNMLVVTVLCLLHDSLSILRVRAEKTPL